MAGDKAKPRIGKHDAGQLDRWHRNAASQPEILATAEAQTRRNPYEGNQNNLVHGIYAVVARRVKLDFTRTGDDSDFPVARTMASSVSWTRTSASVR